MYVCICRRVSDTELRNTIATGAQNLDEVGQRCGAGTDCGACHEEIADFLQEARCQRQTGTWHQVHDLSLAA
jgi:bacterioferritin-associated ferredoxin